MRTVLIGSDFMYDSEGNIKLLEINTATGWDGLSKVEDDVDCIDLTGLDAFVKSKNFQHIHYVGDLVYFNNMLKDYCQSNSISYVYYPVGIESITVPYIEDADDILIIRSSYDTTALVDDTYCKDKVNFMKLIESEAFGSKFAYIDESSTLVSSITEIKDNGVHPNFILKSRFPGYDTNVYPKLFKVSNQAELDTVIANNVNANYFLMEFYVNEENTWNGHQKIIRSLNLLTPPNLESIQIGQYTKVNPNFILDTVTYDPTTFQIDDSHRDSYVSVVNNSALPKVLDVDLIELADGTFKLPVDLVVGDMLKTVDIPNPNNVDTANPNADYGITYEELVSGTTYSVKPLLSKKQINTFVMLATVLFEDGDTWTDAEGANYLVNKNNNIQFVSLGNLVAGDVILLLNTASETVEYIPKTVVSFTTTKEVFSGWEIAVEVPHVFLTKNPLSTEGDTHSYVEYVAIVHNQFCPAGCTSCMNCLSCAKPFIYCHGNTCTNLPC